MILGVAQAPQHRGPTAGPAARCPTPATSHTSRPGRANVEECVGGAVGYQHLLEAGTGHLDEEVRGLEHRGLDQVDRPGAGVAAGQARVPAFVARVPPHHERFEARAGCAHAAPVSSGHPSTATG